MDHMDGILALKNEFQNGGGLHEEYKKLFLDFLFTSSVHQLVFG